MSDGHNAPYGQTSTSSFDWKGFSQKTWVIVIAGIVFPPVGMILTWLKPGWPTRTKWIATAVFGLLLIARNQATTEAPYQEEPSSASADVTKPESRSDVGLGNQQIQPMPDLTSRVRRNWLESQQAYNERIFNRTVIAVLQHHYGIVCTPGAWALTGAKQAYEAPIEYEAAVTRADGTTLHVRLREKNYQFAWAAYEGGISPRHAIGYWLRDGKPISEPQFISFKGHKHGIAKAEPPGSKLTALKAIASHLKGFPDRFAPDSERTAFNDELRMLIDSFIGIAFDAKEHPSTAKAIVELFESKIEGQFNGHLYNILMEHVQGIYAESLDR